jgi:hypothetical protein
MLQAISNMLPAMAEPRFGVVSPEGLTRVPERPARASLDDLNGRTICEVWDWLYRGDLIFEGLRDELRSRYPGIKIVGYENFGNIHGPDAARVLRQLPELLKEHGCDAVIAGVGA